MEQMDSEFTLSKNGNAEPEVDMEGSWAVSYGDMITLLLAFFTIFFSVDKSNSSKINFKLNNAVIEKFNDTTGDKVGSADKNSELINSFKGVAYKDGNAIIIEFPDVSFFNSGETDLNNSGKKALTQFLKQYMPYAGNYTISIRAYTDQRKVMSGKRYKDNLELSGLRSIATMRYLQRNGIPLNKMRTAGYGEMNATAVILAEKNKDSDKRNPASITKVFDLSRKIVLVIEQESL